MPNHPHTVVIGAGPAGLCAAHELLKNQVPVSIFELEPRVGGIARTETYQGFLFDIGGHRFHSDNPEGVSLWKSILGADFLKVARTSRIYFKGRMVAYPLQASELGSILSVPESIGLVASNLRARLNFSAPGDDLEDWLIRRFGRRLYDLFFRSYTEKVWGLPCSQIQADWAPQRIQGLSMWSILLKSLGLSQSSSANLISDFYYPRLGCGMMWEALARQITALGGEVYLGHRVVALQRDARGISGVLVEDANGRRQIPARRVISSIPLPVLMESLRPKPPEVVLQAARNLQFRSFIMVGLILECGQISKDQWIYVHDPELKVGRLQVFKNWSAQMVPDPARSSLGMEYFCSQGDDMWQKSDSELITLAVSELDLIFPGMGAQAVQGVVHRISHAYPVYTLDYKRNLQTVLDFIESVTGLFTMGRNGLHRYNNMDHSMLSGINTAKRLLA